MEFNLNDFETKLMAFTWLSHEDHGHLWSVSYSPKNLGDFVLRVFTQLGCGNVDEALYECAQRFHLKTGSPQEVRLRSILQHICDLPITKTKEKRLEPHASTAAAKNRARGARLI
jgi:hypothetical protein